MTFHEERAARGLPPAPDATLCPEHSEYALAPDGKCPACERELDALLAASRAEEEAIEYDPAFAAEAARAAKFDLSLSLRGLIPRTEEPR